MKKFFFQPILAVVVLSFATTASHAQFRKPDMTRIYRGAAEAFHRAKAEGKTFKEGQNVVATPRNGVREYTQLPADMRVPGQFEETQAVIMTWRYGFDSATSNIPVLSDTALFRLGKVSADLAVAIQQSAKVIIRVSSAQDSTAVKNFMIARGTPLTNYSFYVHGINDWWDRDSGPISFYYGLQDSIGMVDMDYYTIAALKDSSGNIYNDFNLINSGSRLFDDSIPLKISQKLGYPLYRTPLNDEGGNIISDGLGTFWGSDGTRRSNTTAQSFPFLGDFEIFANYPLPTQAQFDTLFKKSFGLKGHVESKVFECDGGTGHIDIFGKLIDENTFALVDYSKAVNHPDFANWNTNLAMFRNLKGTDGKPLNIPLLPMPLTPSGAFQTDCDTSVLFGTPDQKTYVNGIFVNKNYLMPIQSDATNPNAADKAAMAAFRKAMPGYKIVPVDAGTMHGTGGAIHCITMQIPAENPLFIRHTALRGKQPLLSSYDIKADIKNRSGIMDAKVYYRKSGQTQWQSRPLSQINEIQFTASLPSTGFALTDTIEYFIEAQSRNGKTMTKPFTAREGGYWRFTLTNSVSTKEEKTADNLQIFPNPSTGLFQIQGLDGLNEAVDVSVVSVLGQVVSTQKVASGNAFLDLTNQPTGMYFAKFSGKNWQKTVRLVKN